MDELHQILKKYWGFTEFRSLQLDVIHSVMRNNDTLALMPTGGGKSICYQVPALAKPGICIVISPLIALMIDQVDALTQKGIKAIAITSVMKKHEIDIALDNCIHGNFKFLYLSPERLNSEIVQARIQKMNVNLIAVDESHCISQWGYDFRPNYLKIAAIRALKPSACVLALTATATSEVIKDIQEKLLFTRRNVLKKSFFRKSLAYIVIHEEDKVARLIKLCHNIKGSGIVYVRSRRKTRDLALILEKNGINSSIYHAGLSYADRTQRQNEWLASSNQVIVCTNAFGLGIDKPNVRLVVHIDPPDSIESYFQEAGRAGRNEQKAFSILLYNDADKVELERSLLGTYPDLSIIRQTYQALANYYQLPNGSGEGRTFEFDISLFCNRFNLNPLQVHSSIQLLERDGYLRYSEFSQPSRIHFTTNRNDLYTFQIENRAYDDFIKLLLRSYSGIFDNYVKLNESDLVLKSGLKRDQVIARLNYLAKVGLISYIPQNELPQISYTRPRIETNRVIISNEVLKFRKEKALERLEAMINYATNPDKCRSQLLLAYFGEMTSERCGICDYCIERNSSEINTKEFEDVSSEIKSLLLAHHLSLKELVNSVTGARENKTLKVIQWLLDNRSLTYDENNLLQWN